LSTVATRICQTIAGLRNGKHTTPDLFQYAHDLRKKEYSHLVRALSGFVVVMLVLVAGLTGAIWRGRIHGIGEIIVVIAFNIYGWFAYGWFKEMYDLILSYRDQMQQDLLAAREVSTRNNRIVTPIQTISTAPSISRQSVPMINIGGGQ